MRWLSFLEAKASLRSGDLRAQNLVFYSDAKRVKGDIPTPPRLISTEEGAPAPIIEWYGQIGTRVLIVQMDEVSGQSDASSVTVVTPYRDEIPSTNEWETLYDLEALPQSIFVSRPRFIASRTSNISDVVFRPNFRGFADAIYSATTRREAEELLHYLRKDAANQHCFIGGAEPSGEWAIFRSEKGVDVCVGAYPEQSSALMVACDASAGQSGATFIVKDVSARSSSEYRVSEGRVLRL